MSGQEGVKVPEDDVGAEQCCAFKEKETDTHAHCKMGGRTSCSHDIFMKCIIDCQVPESKKEATMPNTALTNAIHQNTFSLVLR